MYRVFCLIAIRFRMVWVYTMFHHNFHTSDSDFASEVELFLKTFTKNHSCGFWFCLFSCRYPVIPTLLTRIYWWRVCLDEAQMVESTAAAATEMALRLHSKHHWCITGTPIQRKLDDLYGLLRFIKASPFNTYRWWSEVIRDPYEVFYL